MNARNELKQIEKIVVGTMGNEEVTVGEVYEVNCDIIDDCLYALEIIVKKRVDLYYHLPIFKSKVPNDVALETYNKGHKVGYKLTQEEFDLLKEVLGDDH